MLASGNGDCPLKGDLNIQLKCPQIKMWTHDVEKMLFNLTLLKITISVDTDERPGILPKYFNNLFHLPPRRSAPMSPPIICRRRPVLYLTVGILNVKYLPSPWNATPAVMGSSHIPPPGSLSFLLFPLFSHLLPAPAALLNLTGSERVAKVAAPKSNFWTFWTNGR